MCAYISPYVYEGYLKGRSEVLCFLKKASQFQLHRTFKVYTKTQMLVTVISGLRLRHDKLTLSRFHFGRSAYSCTDIHILMNSGAAQRGNHHILCLTLMVTASSCLPRWAELMSLGVNTSRSYENQANVKFSSARVL